jgi:tripartite-type tricarboxylate transporter receptor subunit TctC
LGKRRKIVRHSARILARALLAALALAFSVPAWTQGFPNKPIRLVVPYPPGGTVDILARSVGEGMSQLLGQPVIVENKPGAGGTVAAAYVAQSAPDGYTLFVADVGPLAISRSIYKSLPYDSVKDFQPITLGSVSTLTVAVHPALPAKNVKELVALAKSQPGKINFSSSGVGSIIHTAGELFKMIGGVDMTHVPYKGGAPAVNAVLAGEVQVGFLQLPTTLALAQAGKVSLLAVTQGKRSRLAPEIPTVAEAGLAGYEVSVWQGIVAPKGTPREVIDRLHGAIVAALKKPETNARLSGLGFDVVTNSPAEFGEMIRSEADKWERVVKAANIQPE